MKDIWLHECQWVFVGLTSSPPLHGCKWKDYIVIHDCAGKALPFGYIFPTKSRGPVKVWEAEKVRQNLCKPLILNKCLEIEFTANKERQRRKGDKEKQLSDLGITCERNEVTVLCSWRPFFRLFPHTAMWGEELNSFKYQNSIVDLFVIQYTWNYCTKTWPWPRFFLVNVMLVQRVVTTINYTSISIIDTLLILHRKLHFLKKMCKTTECR